MYSKLSKILSKNIDQKEEEAIAYLRFWLIIHNFFLVFSTLGKTIVPVAPELQRIEVSTMGRPRQRLQALVNSWSTRDKGVNLTRS